MWSGRGRKARPFRKAKSADQQDGRGADQHRSTVSFGAPHPCRAEEMRASIFLVAAAASLCGAFRITPLTARSRHVACRSTQPTMEFEVCCCHSLRAARSNFCSPPSFHASAHCAPLCAPRPRRRYSTLTEARLPLSRSFGCAGGGVHHSSRRPCGGACARHQRHGL